MRDNFSLFGLKSLLSFIHFGFSLNKMVYSTQSKFLFYFPLFLFLFFIFLSSTYYGVWLCCRKVIDLFDDFRVGNSCDRAISIEYRSYIKSLLISIHHQILNIRYFRYIRITNYIDFELFIIVINQDVMSSLMFLALWFICRDVMFCYFE